MRSVVSSFPIAIVVAVAGCSGGSGVDSGKTVPSLTDAEYTKLCTFYNQKAHELVGKKCDTQAITEPPAIPCGMTNQLAGSSCAARVSDVEACINSTDACVVTGKNQPSGQCIVVNNCFPKR